MKIEIKGDCYNCKVLIDGKDVSGNCESVQMDVKADEPVRTTLVFIGAEVEAEIAEDADTDTYTYTRKSLIDGDITITNVKTK